MIVANHDDHNKPGREGQSDPATPPVHVNLDLRPPVDELPACAPQPAGLARVPERDAAVLSDWQARRLGLPELKARRALLQATSPLLRHATAGLDTIARATLPSPAEQHTIAAAATITASVRSSLASISAGPQMTFTLPALRAANQADQLLAGMTPWLPSPADTLQLLGAVEAFQAQNRWQIMTRTRALLPLDHVLEDLFAQWRHVAGQPGPQQHAAAQAFEAALRTREAILTQVDPQPAVIEFGVTWLGFAAMPQTRVEATMMALLDDQWPGYGADFREQMRMRVNRHHEVQRPIGDRQINGRRIVSLDAPIRSTPVSALVTLLDVTAGPDAVEPAVMARLGGWSDPRIQRVLDHLGEQERAVVAAYARGGDDTTWAAAAAETGADKDFGERVRRALKRHGTVLTARAGASATMRAR